MALQGHITSEKAEILDKNNVILTTLTTALPHCSAIGEAKAKIWLNNKLYIVKFSFLFMAFVGFSVPVTANAGIFSFIEGLVGSKEADAESSQMTSQNMPLLQGNFNPNATGGAEITIVDGSALAQESGVAGTQADLLGSKSTQISLYVVRQGDSLSQIAKMFGVSVSTIVWANDIKKGLIHEGDELVILPVTGVSHTVKKGDTVRSIATKYKADMGDILSFNDIKSDTNLVVGSAILIPDGEITAPVSNSLTSPLRSSGGPLYKGYYMRPLSGGYRSQGLHGHNGVDIAAPIGTPIYASADGSVIVSRPSGYNGGYGAYVVVSHSNGTQTLYAHASKVLVSQGQSVSKGDIIGLVGTSGKSTGSHLHFEIRGAANPF